MSTPDRLTALLDQTDAAAAHGARIFAALAQRSGSPITAARPVGIVGSIVGRLIRQAESGQLTVCAHLSPAAPMPTFWVPWAPGRFKCAACLREAGRRITGTAEDRRCDHCRQVNDSIYDAGVQLPAMLAADVRGLAVAFGYSTEAAARLPDIGAIGPVTVIFGLCRACHMQLRNEHDTEPIL